MAELFAKLGIDWKLLVANTITFFLVLWILRKFAYQPILSMLDKRQKTIHDSLSKAKQAEDDLHRLETEKESMLKDAKQQAQQIMHQAEQQADTIRQEKLATAQTEADKLFARTKAQLQREQEQMLTDARGKLAGLVVTATGKIMEEQMDTKTEKVLQGKAEKALKELAQ